MDAASKIKRGKAEEIFVRHKQGRVTIVHYFSLSHNHSLLLIIIHYWLSIIHYNIFSLHYHSLFIILHYHLPHHTPHPNCGWEGRDYKHPHPPPIPHPTSHPIPTPYLPPHPASRGGEWGSVKREVAIRSLFSNPSSWIQSCFVKHKSLHQGAFPSTVQIPHDKIRNGGRWRSFSIPAQRLPLSS